MRLDAAPKRRQDIISSILSDYGDSRDADDDVDLDDYYTQAQPSPVPGAAAAPASPAAKDKPLPPLVGFQLRVADAPAALQPGAPSGNTPEANMIISSFRGRRQKPPDLKLARSNGSTAITPATAATPAKPDSSSLLPSLTLSAPHPQHLPTHDRVRGHASARLLDERPLPPTPPQPPAKNDARPPSDHTISAAGAAAMGNKASKAAGDATSPSQRSKFSLRRKPVRKDAVPPAEAANGASKPPPQGDVAPGALAGAAQAPAPPPAPPMHTSASTTSLQQSVAASDSQPSASHYEANGHLQSPSTTMSDATVVRARSNSPPTEPEDEEPITPTLKPAAVDLLPSPSPVPEESPSKYGVVEKPGNPETEKPKVAMHYRGKSSTGFDIFKSSTNKLQNTRPYMGTHPPPVPSNPATVMRVPSAITSPLELTSPTLADSTLPAFEFFNTQLRPEGTIVPRLNCVHMQCFHNHRRFHRSNNRLLPIGCMLCFSCSPDPHWTCTWCALRICQGCRAKLESIPRKSLDILIKEKAEEKIGEKPVGDTVTARNNKENLMVKKNWRSMHEPSKVVVWES
ncbi:hypothetical protein BFW01_g9408 [Lasiodiplodia theobromae]|nr:hypothetical protein BFW01_g9408 [Lasiodiplodia theobromae]